jgi:hypothetical protein
MSVLVQQAEPGPVSPPASAVTRIDLFWLPLGAGGWFVRRNGRLYEAVHAILERRTRFDLYHSALEVQVAGTRYVIENAWPIPDAGGASRGVVVEGPVLSRRLARFRVFRYEVRRWPKGAIPDVAEAVASPQLLSDDAACAHRLLDLVGSLPNPAWGRDEFGTGEMWNSNSVISWLIARSGLPVGAVKPPAGGRAPGWNAGVVVAARAEAGVSEAAVARGAQLLPGHLAATRTGLAPAGDDELTTKDHLQGKVTSSLLGARKIEVKANAGTPKRDQTANGHLKVYRFREMQG